MTVLRWRNFRDIWIITVLLLFMSTACLENSQINTSLTSAPPTSAPATNGTPDITKPIEFEDLIWVNSKPYTLEELRGQVVMVEFWNKYCSRCEWLEPQLKEKYDRYRARGFIIIGLNIPATPEEKNLDYMKEVVSQKNITYPIALDNQFKNWFNFEKNYGEIYTGTIYLFDKKGDMRYKIGTGEYNSMDEKVEELLVE